METYIVHSPRASTFVRFFYPSSYQTKHTYIHINTHTRTFTHIHRYMQAHAYIHTYTNTHTYMPIHTNIFFGNVLV